MDAGPLIKNHCRWRLNNILLCGFPKEVRLNTTPFNSRGLFSLNEVRLSPTGAQRQWLSADITSPCHDPDGS
jgi:hypothetical protein